VKFFYYKNIAAHSDASEMSHPVLQNVVDTEVAESIFDSITYNKGSGVI
jgi:aminopeptidase N